MSGCLTNQEWNSWYKAEGGAGGISCDALLLTHWLAFDALRPLYGHLVLPQKTHIDSLMSPGFSFLSGNKVERILALFNPNQAVLMSTKLYYWLHQTRKTQKCFSDVLWYWLNLTQKWKNSCGIRVSKWNCVVRFKDLHTVPYLTLFHEIFLACKGNTWMLQNTDVEMFIWVVFPSRCL